MKSDSGGEMESCRSSDSELERELHEKEREIQERDRELTNCYRTIAERDTGKFFQKHFLMNLSFIGSTNSFANVHLRSLQIEVCDLLLDY